DTDTGLPFGAALLGRDESLVDPVAHGAGRDAAVRGEGGGRHLRLATVRAARGGGRDHRGLARSPPSSSGLLRGGSLGPLLGEGHQPPAVRRPDPRPPLDGPHELRPGPDRARGRTPVVPLRTPCRPFALEPLLRLGQAKLLRLGRDELLAVQPARRVAHSVASSPPAARALRLAPLARCPSSPPTARPCAAPH